MRGERLGGDDEECALRVTFFESLGHVGAVDVRDEMYVGSDAERLQSFRDHQGSEVCVVSKGIELSVRSVRLHN